MYSNFITPPDFVDNILVVDASSDEIQLLTEFLHNAETSYNVYMYRNEMDNEDWLLTAIQRADTVLRSVNSELEILNGVTFGDGGHFATILDYFNK